MTVTVTPDRVVLPPTPPPPAFDVATDVDRALFDVEVATDPQLFGGSLARRRPTGTYYTSASDAHPPALRARHGTYRLDATAWAALRRAPFLYYRAIAFDGTRAAPTNVQRSVDDANLFDAPFLRISPSAAGQPQLRRNLSDRLPWLSVSGNELVDASGRRVVLRGLNRSELHYAQPNFLDPTGVSRPTSLQVAGITQGEIHEIVHRWGANVIRLPFNGHAALTDGTYLAGLDQVVAWAAIEGAYTMLCLHYLDYTRRFLLKDGSDSHQAPMPEENSVRMWEALASRYVNQPAVLFDIYNEPYDATPNDPNVVFELPTSQNAWLAMWHDWARRIEGAIHRVHPRAVLVVSGWNWGLDLTSFPIPMPGATLRNAVYACHIYPWHTTTRAGFEHWFGFPRLRLRHPIFVAEWGGRDGDSAWGRLLEAYMRERHRVMDGVWQGLSGWTAWSWGDYPHLVVRTDSTNAQGYHYRTYDRERAARPGERADDIPRVPTPFGTLVKDALHRAP